MARLVLGVAGAYVGSFVGMSGLGWAIGSAIGGAVDSANADPIRTEGPRMSDLKMQFSSYGNMVPIVYGTMRIAGNVIWASEIHETSSTTSSGGGKGGGGPSQETTTYSYSVDLAVALCEGEITAVRKVWANGQLIYNIDSTADTATVTESGKAARSFKTYTGTETQTADPTIEADKGAGNVPGYRGLAYVVFDNLELADFGNRVPNFEFEVVNGGTLTNTRLISTSLQGYQSSNAWAVVDNNLLWIYSNTGGTSTALYDLATSDTIQIISGSQFHPCGRDGQGNILLTDTSGGTGTFEVDRNGVKKKWYDPSTGGALSPNFDFDENSAHLLDGFWVGSSTAGVYAIEPYYVATAVSGAPSNQTKIGGLTDVKFTQGCDRIKGVLVGMSANVIVAYSKTSEAWRFGVSNAYLGRYTVDTDGYIYVATSAASGTIEKYNQAGVLQGSCVVSGYTQTAMSAPSDSGRLVVQKEVAGTAWIVVIDTSTMTVFDSITTGITTANVSMLQSSGDFAAFTVNVAGVKTIWAISLRPSIDADATASSATLSDVVSDLCTRSGLTTGAINVTALTSLVRGYALTRPAAARANLVALQKAYYFDAVESDNKLKFVNRGGSSAFTLTYDELGAYEYASTPVAPISITRLQEVDLPVVVTVSFPNPDNDYQTATESSRRLLTSSKQVVAEEIPVVMTPTRAQAIADTLIYDAHIARMSYEFSTTRKYAKYEPTDIVTLTNAAGVLYTARITTKNEAGALIKWTAVADDANNYPTTGTPGTTATASGAIASPSKTNMVLLDIPIVRDQDDDPGFYAALNSPSSAWPGAAIYKSTNAVDFTQLTSVSSSAVSGVADTALATFVGGWTVDEKNTVDVTLVAGTLAACTYDQLLNGYNVALIGSEIIAFRDATLLSTDKYRLGGLLRGLRGTEAFISTHALAERFVMLTTAGFARVPLTTAEIGVEQYWKGVTLRTLPTDVGYQVFTNTALGLKPLSPVNVGGGKQANGDFIITWVRRSRVGTVWRDYVDVPLGETSESYSIELYSTSAPTTLRRTMTATTTTVTYTAAMQTTDGGALSAGALTAVIYQVSSTFGRGSSVTATI